MEDVTSDLCLCPGIFVGDLVTECKEALTEILTDPLTVFYAMQHVLWYYFVGTPGNYLIPDVVSRSSYILISISI
jgi:hypothetical protein